MPKALTEAQIEAYHRDGAIWPIPMLSAAEAAECQRRFDELEASLDGEVQGRYRIKAHLPFPWLTDLIHHPALLDAMEDLMGPNIVIWGSSFFTKPAHDPRFVSWHQDSTYYGLEPPESVTAWLAFSPSTGDAGCLQIIPGSHKGEAILPHLETDDPNNILSRGQTIENIDESVAVEMPLEPGQFSIHHNKTIHGSLPNKSDTPRIGFAIHFATPEIRQTQFEGATASLVRGEDTHGHWLPDSVAKHDMDPDCLEELDVCWQRYRNAMKSPAAKAD
ncbi:MAG: phytanoyl-CoA dioxygenase family protein [Rhodospirillales bacterium]|nr:phytanoyl-CoA dioxygenase family protein [Rhodospirillales bacterium]